MPTVMAMHWPEVSKAQYEQVREVVQWDRDVPPGGRVHVAWLGDDGFHVIDVWDSAEQFQAFVTTRLMPGVQQVGVEGQPKVEMHEVIGVSVPEAYKA